MRKYLVSSDVHEYPYTTYKECVNGKKAGGLPKVRGTYLDTLKIIKSNSFPWIKNAAVEIFRKSINDSIFLLVVQEKIL